MVPKINSVLSRWHVDITPDLKALCAITYLGPSTGDTPLPILELEVSLPCNLTPTDNVVLLHKALVCKLKVLNAVLEPSWGSRHVVDGKDRRLECRQFHSSHVVKSIESITKDVNGELFSLSQHAAGLTTQQLLRVAAMEAAFAGFKQTDV